MSQTNKRSFNLRSTVCRMRSHFHSTSTLLRKNHPNNCWNPTDSGSYGYWDDTHVIMYINLSFSCYRSTDWFTYKDSIQRVCSPLVSLVSPSEALAALECLEYANSPSSLTVLLASQSFEKSALQFWCSGSDLTSLWKYLLPDALADHLHRGASRKKRKNKACISRI